MFVAMNVVQVEDGNAEEFEQAFGSRERLLSQAEGFAGFELLRRDSGGEYVVLSRWDSREAFDSWVSSDLFRRAHKHVENGGRPHAHGNEVRLYDVLDVEAPAA